MEPDVRTPGEPPLDPAVVARIKWGAIVVALLGLAALVYFLFRAKGQEEVLARWDELALIRERFEGERSQDPLFEDPAGVYTERRDRYAKALEGFLGEVGKGDGALVAHVRYLLAKIYTDQFYASQDPGEAEARERYYGLAKKHWEVLRDDHPDFPGNRLEFAPAGHGSVVRMVLANLEANHAWAEEHFARPEAPDTETVVVFRTERGDMKMGLYTEDAPELVETFLDRVRRGAYDGTYFFARTDEGSEEDPIRRTIRGGHAGVREVDPYDADDAARFAESGEAPAMLPAPSRHRIAAAEGVVATWHEEANPYDGSHQILVAVDRSPQLDYTFSPLGRLLDEPSRATASRIFDGETWGDATRDDPPANIDEIRAMLRAPVRIVKALAYRDGTLLEPEGGSLATKAAVDASEEALADLVTDAYRIEAPQAPDAPDDPDAPTDGEAPPTDE